jgi:NDP-4-keto-2,6-dideoxyhexose 3-C-methyltransferase
MYFQDQALKVYMACRICKTATLEDVIDLGDQVITSRFPVYGDWSTPKTPICLGQCKECGLVQLRSLVASSELYEHAYGYRSGINPMMRKHLEEYNVELQSKVSLNSGDAVLDIGSNDATFLRFYPETVTRVGCDPTGKQFAEYYDGLTLVPTYFTAANVAHLGLTFKAVSSISMFYDLPDPVQFARDIHSVLAEDGVWTLEQSYIGTMLERNSIDTICHEHVEYYAMRQIKTILDLAGFVIVGVQKNECNGGSFRIYAAKSGAESPDVATWLQEEARMKLEDPETYRRFERNCRAEVEKLKEFLAANPSTYIYGASTKGNCLLQYAGITEADIPFAVERNLEKVGKMTSTGIPIISEETMRATPPKNLLVLPWHFREGIVERESEFLRNGGTLVFPFPHLSIVSF